MDNKTRAEKIVNQLTTKLSFSQVEWAIKEITSQLDEAVREAHAEEYKKLAERLGDRGFSEYKLGGEEGFASAREKAADEADEHNGCIDPECCKRNCPVVIAERIRAMELP